MTDAGRSSPRGAPRFWIAAGVAGAACLWAAAALAAGGEGGGKGPSEALFVAEVVALMLVGRLLGEAMTRIGQPAVVGQLIAGVVLGRSVFGLIAPQAQSFLFPHDPAQKAMLDGVAHLGVLFLLLLTGIETDVALVRRVGRPAAAISLAGVAVPFAVGVTAGLTLLPPSLVPEPDKRLVTALFLGTALSISSIKIVAMVVDEMRFMRRNLGQIIVASAIIDDTIGWIIIGVTFGLARPEGLDLLHVGGSLGGTALFLLACATVGRRLVAALMRFVNDRFRSELAVVTAILVVMGLMALLTDAIGVNTVLGAFMAGVLVGQSPILTGQVQQELRGLVVAFFAPIFFGLAGVGTDLTILKDPALLGLTAALIAIASLGKFGGAFLGGTLGGLSRPECLALALGMNARGSTEVIVATIGLSIGALNPTLFTMIVTMAVVTTTVMPPTLRWALARLPMSEDEAKRLARESFEARGFLGGIERILLARDGGASGRLAARIAGLLGGSREVPVTVLPLGGADGDALTAEVARASRAPRRAEGSEAGGAPVVDITLRPVEDEGERDAVAAEGAKAYDLLLLGIEPATRDQGGPQPRLMGLVGAVDCARLLVMARGRHRSGEDEASLRILVATDGTAAGRRATEVALGLARAARSPVTALFVAEPDGAPHGVSRGRSARPVREEILAETRATAETLGVTVATEVRVSADRASAILGRARRAGDTLVVLGVEPRPSPTMPFGALAHALMEGADHSLVLVVGAGPLPAELAASGQAAQDGQEPPQPGRAAQQAGEQVGAGPA